MISATIKAASSFAARLMARSGSIVRVTARVRVSISISISVRLGVRVRVGVRCFVVTGGRKGVLHGSVAEGGGRGVASGLWLEGRL